MDRPRLSRAEVVVEEQRAALPAHGAAAPTTPPRNGDLAEQDAGSAPDPFFVYLARFAIMFEETYLRWLHEALAFVEARIGSKSHHTT